MARGKEEESMEETSSGPPRAGDAPRSCPDSLAPVGRSRDRAMVAVVFLAIAVLYVASVPGVWFMKSDSAVYMTLARSLARGEGYTFNHGPYGRYPPVFPAMLALVYGTLGESIWAMQALVALTGAGAMAVAFALIRERSGTRPALAIIILAATCTWFWSYSSQHIVSEAPYTLFSLMALWLAERALRSPRSPALKWSLAVGVATVAIYTRMPGVALIPALVAAALLARGQHWARRQRLIAAGAAGIIGSLAALVWVVRAWAFGPGQTYTVMVLAARNRPLADFVHRLQFRLSEWAATPLSWSYRETPWAAGLAILCALLLPGLVISLKRFRSAAEFYLAAYFILMVLLGGNTSHERYVVPVVPLLLYYGYLSLSALSAWLSEKLGKGRDSALGRRLLWAVRHLAVIAGVALLCFAVRERVKHNRGAKRFSPRRRLDARRRVLAWRRASAWADRYIPEDATVYGPWSRTYYFTERHSRNPAKVNDTRLELAHVLTCGARFALVEPHDVSRLFIKPVISRFPQCFTPVCAARKMVLYRIERERIRETLTRLGVDVAGGARKEYKGGAEEHDRAGGDG